MTDEKMIEFMAYELFLSEWSASSKGQKRDPKWELLKDTYTHQATWLLSAMKKAGLYLPRVSG